MSKNNSTVLNFWDLAIIISAAIGLSGFISGGLLAKNYGVGVAIPSAIVGHFILWAVGLGIIAMSQHGKSNAIQNVKYFLGKPGSLVAAIILISGFLSWYSLQLESAVKSYNSFFQQTINMSEAFGLRIGIGLGLFISLIAMGGLHWIRNIFRYGTPFLILYMIYVAISRDHQYSSIGPWGLSFAPVVYTISANLAGMVNLPTFYRHSRSRADSFFSLTLFTILTAIFEFFSIWAGITSYESFFSGISGHLFTFYSVATIIFILLALVMSNLVNIYFATAGLEALFPRKAHGAKEYIFLGLLGTGFFSFMQVSRYMEFLISTANNFLASLGVVLLCAFIVSIIVKHRPRPLEKYVSNICWFVGCITAIVVQIKDPDTPSSSFLAGITASAITFLVVSFIEETVWATYNLPRKKKKL